MRIAGRKVKRKYQKIDYGLSGRISFFKIFLKFDYYFLLALVFRPPLDFRRPSLFSSTASVISSSPLSSALWLVSSSGSTGSKLGVDWGVVLAVGWRFSLSGLDMFRY